MNIKCNNTTIKITKFDESFPVGCLFFSINSTNPSTLLGGGTWTRIAQGRTLVGLDENDSDFKTAEKTGGEKTHKLTLTELPNNIWHSNSGSQTGGLKQAFVQVSPSTGGASGINTIGSNFDKPHNNLQPYYVTYIWKRTA